MFVCRTRSPGRRVLEPGRRRAATTATRILAGHLIQDAPQELILEFAGKADAQAPQHAVGIQMGSELGR